MKTTFTLYPSTTPFRGANKKGGAIMQTLYQALRAASIPRGSHESDLYFKGTPEALAILDNYPQHKQNAKRFINQAPPHLGEHWVDVPFAYDPYWEAKSYPPSPARPSLRLEPGGGGLAAGADA